MSMPRSSSVPTTTGSSTTVLSILSSTLGEAFGTGLPPGCERQHSLYTSFVNLLSVAPPTVLLALLTVGAGPDAKAPGASVAAPPAPPPLAQVMARVDELHKRRDDRAAWAEEQSLVEGALARAPRDYAVLWRAARVRFWLSDDPGQSKEQRSLVGKDGWDLAERCSRSEEHTSELQSRSE